MLPLGRILESDLANTRVPSQVTLPERRILKYLASLIPPDTGDIVDLGSGAGSATLAISEGLDERDSTTRPSIHAYDWFSVGAGHYASRHFKAVSDPSSESFLEDFRYFLSSYMDSIVVHAGDITKTTWEGGPISMLHVDICKNVRIFKHVARQFFPSLRPGSFLIHQDFSRPRLPWLHYSMGMMMKFVTLIYRTRGSVYYMVNEAIDDDTIAEMTSSVKSVAQLKHSALLGIEFAKKGQAGAVGHFSCLGDLVEIYIDYWFGDQATAR